MPYFEFIWTDEILEHIAENDISIEDFQEVVCQPTRQGASSSSGLPAAWGYTRDGRYIFAVYEELDDLTLLPVTAYEVREPRLNRVLKMQREAREIHRDLTPEEQARLKRLRAEVKDELPDMIRRDQLRKTASEEDTPSGALRRAIHRGDLTLNQIAQRVGVTTLELDRFLTGEATLPSDVIDRLAKAVGCKLVPIE